MKYGLGKMAGMAAMTAMFGLFAQASQATEKINIMVAASHPPAVAWIGQITNTFIPEVNKILAETGNYEINFTEAYSGQLYKATETLSAVSNGITDIGWVFSLLESSRLPLTQVTGHVPGVTGNPTVLMDIFNELNDTVPALQQEWDKQNVVFLAATAGDSTQLFTKEPVKSLADLKGLKLSAPGSIGTWLGGTGAIPVDGAATTFYTDAATGLTDGSITTLSVSASIKYFEVGPNVMLTDLGGTYFGALTVNKDFWNGLPEEVQNALKTASRTYSKAVGDDVNGRVNKILDNLRNEGASMNPPVTVTEMSEEDRKAWFAGLPNLAQAWVDTNEAAGLPAREILNAYLAKAREKGATPMRDWDKEISQ